MILRVISSQGHLFPSREQGWTNRLDDVPPDGEMAPQPHPGEKEQNKESYKLRENLVAVNRTCFYFSKKITIPLRTPLLPVRPSQPRQTASVLVAS